MLGVAAHPWGKFPDKSQLQMAVETLGAAVADAGLGLHELQGVVAASSRFEGGLGWGLHANEMLQTVGESGIPAVNVGGGCAAGSIAVHTASGMIASGQSDIVAAVGAERMPRDSFQGLPGGLTTSAIPTMCAGSPWAPPTQRIGPWRPEGACMSTGLRKKPSLLPRY